MKYSVYFAVISILSCLLLTSCGFYDDEVNPVPGSSVIPLPESGRYLETDFVTYTIPKGSHRSVRAIKPFVKRKFEYQVIFDSTAVYQIVGSNNQHDLNKLPGFSDCKSAHHENSARFGWRWFNNELQIFAYTYVNGERQSEFIGVVSLNSSHFYSIKLEGNSYLFTLDDKVVSMPRGCSDETADGFMLYPYFGGDEVAPHTVSIYIRYLKDDKVKN